MTMELARPETTIGTLARMEAQGGMVALARMPEDEFRQKLDELKKGIERVQLIHREVMDAEVDYGIVPGTDKPSLKQSGSEKLLLFYGFAPRFETKVTYGDAKTAPPISVECRCYVHLGSHEGPIVNEGVGAASSWEKRYRYRRGERSCPSCGLVGTVIRGKEEFGGGWICFAKKGGCGAKFRSEDPAITEQVVGDIDNPDPFDLLNTLVKMAAKRAQVDAAKRATGTSALYTQDVEDMDLGNQQGTPPPQETGRTQGQQRAAAATRQGETQGSHAGATGADVRKCSEDGCGATLTNGQLTASMNKFQRPLCPKHQTEQANLKLQHPDAPPANEKPARKKLMDQLHAVYSELCDKASFESDDPTMRRHLSVILTKERGKTVIVTSKTGLSDEDLETCVAALKRDGLPDLDRGGVAEQQGDPFENE